VNIAICPTRLHMLARAGDADQLSQYLACAKYSVEKQIHVLNYHHESALHLAVLSADSRSVEVLVSMGSSVNLLQVSGAFTFAKRLPFSNLCVQIASKDDATLSCLLPWSSSGS